MTNKSKNVAVESLSGNRELCTSYGVPVAAFVPGIGYVKTDKRYSVTTSKHANQYAGRDARILPDAEFRALIANTDGGR